MPSRFRAFLTALLIGGALYACGDSNGGESPPGTSPENPCTSAALTEEAAVEPATPTSEDRVRRKANQVDANPRWRVLEALWTHRQRTVRTGTAAETAGEAPAVGRRGADIGEIAVLQDEGDLTVPANPFDLHGTGLRFTRNNASGYDVRRISGDFRQTLGRQLTLTDDASEPVNVPFSFTFFGRNQTAAFVNSDGNITFEEEDTLHTDRSVARLLTGPPRISPFFADLDPSTGGRVFVNAAMDQYTVTWCDVRGFDSTRTTTVQMTFLPDGIIEMKYGEAGGLVDAVVGLSPGRTTEFRPVNLSETGPTSGGDAAVGERFAAQTELDAVAVVQKFYRSHPDSFDQLVIWTDAPLVQDAFAYEATVANDIQGIGVEIFDVSRDFGSAGRLRSYTVMDLLEKYSDDPNRKILGENTTLSVLGQEVGHQWLAYFTFRDRTGQVSEALLGRDNAHWSFFLDSDASVMEGNDIEDLGGGSFRTTAAVERYSRLDQYAMGLVSEAEVPPFFYVENPMNVQPSRESDDAPRVGVTFNGTRRDVLIQDIVAINGPRVPAAANAPKVHRQAFVYVVSAGRQTDAGQVDKLDRIRKLWEVFFLQATDGRMRALTTLR
jgi:hypothetical protein